MFFMFILCFWMCFYVDVLDVGGKLSKINFLVFYNLLVKVLLDVNFFIERFMF